MSHSPASRLILRLWIGAILAGHLCGQGVAQAPAKPAVVARPPNLVILLADDAGYADFGFQAQPASDLQPLTPRIDSIAAAGVRFNQAYMSGCVCSPSRAGLITGRYQCRFGHEFNIPPGYSKGGMALEEKTMADRLRDAGYKTGLVGKWHLGYPAPYQPNRRGFDWFYGLLQGSRSYFPYPKPSPHRVLQENGVPTKEGGYTTDRLGDAAVRFIEVNKAKPFFLFVSFTAPHGPLQAKPEDLAKLTGIAKLRRRRYAGLVKSLDDNVGKILDSLDTHGLAANTLVVFTNDNGGQTKTGANNAPLRGRKGQLLEGGVRVPMAVRWPGVVKAKSTIDDPVIALDLLPTFLAAARVEIKPEWKLDGVDLGPRLRGRVAALAERPLFWRKGGPNREIAMRQGNLNLHFADRSVDSAPALYDLSTDVGEAQNLAADRSEDVARMRKLLAAWESELVAPVWGGGSRRVNRNGKRRKRKERVPSTSIPMSHPPLTL